MNAPQDYEAQLAARAAELLPGLRAEDRLELLAVMDPDDMRTSLAFIASAYPQVFDFSLVRDRRLAERLRDRLGLAGSPRTETAAPQGGPDPAEVARLTRGALEYLACSPDAFIRERAVRALGQSEPVHPPYAALLWAVSDDGCRWTAAVASGVTAEAERLDDDLSWLPKIVSADGTAFGPIADSAGSAMSWCADYTGYAR